jgi:sialic acid synthase SpsE
VFADAGINHDGDMNKALRIVDVAAQPGADYVDEVNEVGAAIVKNPLLRIDVYYHL